MSPESWPEQVAILYEGQLGPGGLGRLFAEGFRSHQCEVHLLGRTAAWEQPYDLVLGYGPTTWAGSLLPAAQQMASYAENQRPFFYWWFIESIPNPRIPIRFARITSKLRIALDRWSARSPGTWERLSSVGLDRFLLRGFRLKIVGELYEFHSKGLLGALAVTSADRAAYLRRHGFRPIVVPIGYHPLLHGQDLGLQRDIDVGFLGSINSKRRHRLLEQVRKDLGSRGIGLSIQTNLYGEERTRFFNRTRVILNIFRAPHDFFGLRFLFCAANQALMVSEPVIDVEPFVPGRHLITEHVENLANTIEFYLHHEEQRRQVVEEAHRLVTEEFTIHQMVGRILDHARGTRSGK